VGLDAQERLAKSHKASYVKDGIWCELMQLHTIEKQKPTEKFVGRKGEAAEEKGKEHYPITTWGIRDLLSTGELDGVFRSYEAVRRDLFHIPLRDGGTNLGISKRLGHGALGG
jgi:hypothetical protein